MAGKDTSHLPSSLFLVTWANWVVTYHLGSGVGGTGHIPTHMTSVPYLLLPLLGLFKTFSIQPFPAKYASCQAEQWGERGRLFSGQEASVAAVRARWYLRGAGGHRAVQAKKNLPTGASPLVAVLGDGAVTRWLFPKRKDSRRNLRKRVGVREDIATLAGENATQPERRNTCVKNRSQIKLNRLLF